MRKEIYVSSEKDLMMSGVEVKASRTWYSSDPSVLKPSSIHWIFADIELEGNYHKLEDESMDVDCEVNADHISYDQIMYHTFNFVARCLSNHNWYSHVPAYPIPIFTLRSSRKPLSQSLTEKLMKDLKIWRLEKKLKKYKQRVRRL